MEHCEHGHAAVLQLHGPQHRNLLLGLSVGDACWIPEVVGERAAGPGNNLLRRRQRPQRGVRVKGPVAPGLSCQSVLEEHANDRHHRQASIGNLCRELLLLLALRCLHEAVGDAKEAGVLEVARGTLGIIDVLEELDGSGEGHHLGPARKRHLAEGSEAGGNVRELQAQGGREITRPAVVLRHDVSHASQHRHTAVLQLHIAAAAEGCSVTAFREAERIPKSSRRLHAKLRLKGARSLVEAIRRAEETVLHPQTDDSHHRQSAVGKLGVQPSLARLRIANALGRDAQHHVAVSELALAVVSRLRGIHRLVDDPLVAAAQGHPLQPALGRNLGDGCQAIWHVGELEVGGWRKVARKLEVLRHHIANSRKHGDAAVLDLRLTTAAEGLYITVL
mmetsp:Transcript_22408/g.46186  ORF Transcript_22408/g.46186 Transcript_22408/m.46186 type:complete len:391 (+) Transcript_22408:530-1702(+)